MPGLAAEFASGVVSRSDTIFHGHVVAAKFLGEDQYEHPQFLITHKVDRWLKGSRSPFAHVVRYFWCDGACDEDQIVSDLIYGHADGNVDNRPKLHFFDRPASKNRHPNQRLDGLVGICNPGSGRSLDDLTTERRRSDYKTFLLEIFLQQEVEKLMWAPHDACVTSSLAFPSLGFRRTQERRRGMEEA
jgi:hypothetical protein